MPAIFKTSILQDVRDYFTITLGLLMYATGFTCFQLPYEITTGGLAGAGAVIFYATGFPVQYTFFMVNIILLTIAVRVLGWRFCVKTIYAVFMLTFLLGMTQEVLIYLAQHNPGMFQNVNPRSGLPQVVTDNIFMSCILGAAIEGIGIGLVFLSNGSTGGTDIIAAIINKHKNMSIGKVLLMVDLSIITSSYLVFHDIQRVVFGYALMAIITFTIDYVVGRNNQSVEFKIYSRNPNPIAELLIKNGMGVTILNGEGYYTHSERKVIISVVTRGEKLLVQRMIKAIDPYAFVTMGNVSGVWGEGFAKMQTKSKEQEKPSLVLLTSNQTEYDTAHAALSDTLNLRTLSDIGCDLDHPISPSLLSPNLDTRLRAIKYYYGHDCLSLDGHDTTKPLTLVTGKAASTDIKILQLSTLDQVKQHYNNKKKKQ